MNDIVSDLIKLIDALREVDRFKDLTDEEIRTLAIDLLKIEEEKRTGNAISNAIAFIDYDRY